jgi:glucose-6-phosphate 1-dehydrogenase
MASWRILENVVQAWDGADQELHVYAKGTTGPEAAKKLAEETGCDWL